MKFYSMTPNCCDYFDESIDGQVASRLRNVIRFCLQAFFSVAAQLLSSTFAYADTAESLTCPIQIHIERQRDDGSTIANDTNGPKDLKIDYGSRTVNDLAAEINKGSVTWKEIDAVNNGKSDWILNRVSLEISGAGYANNSRGSVKITFKGMCSSVKS